MQTQSQNSENISPKTFLKLLRSCESDDNISAPESFQASD